MSLQYLTLNYVKKACAFIVRIEFPLLTLERIIQLLSERKILVESLQMHDACGGEAILILHCLVERDRIKHFQHILEKVQGTIRVELLESR